MAKSRSFHVATVFLALITILFVAACGSGDEEVLLKYTYTTGDSWVYDTTVVMNGTVEGPGLAEADTTIPQDTTTKIRTEATVESIDENGVATVRVTEEVLEMSAAGEPVDVGAQEVQEVTMQIDSTGKVISIDGGDDPASGVAGSLFAGLPFDPSQLTDQLNVVFPEDGVGQVGEEWTATSTFPLPGLDQEVTATSTGKVVSVETVDGREMANVEYTITMPLDLTIDLGALLQGLMGAMGGSDESADIALVITMRGAMDYAGTAQIETETGRAQSSDGVMDLLMDMEITEAPEDMVPAEERGPFSVDLNMTVDMVAVE